MGLGASYRSLLTISAAILLCQSIALSQSDAASISGRIADQASRVLPGVQIKVTNVDTGVGVSTVTNAEGIYAVNDLRPGPYRLSVEKEGFRSIVLSGLILDVQDALGRNFTMQIGPRNESITIRAGGEDKLSPAVSTVVDQQFVENMPLNGRSFQSLIQLTPGVAVTAAGQDQQGQFSVNGQRSNTNYFTVDGVSANFGSTTGISLGQGFGGTLPALTISGGTNGFVSVDAMQEFRIQTSTYSPEFGRSPGAQIAIVTKSGTNQFHGTAYDYFRNDIFDARNYFDQPPQPKPPTRQNDFGGTVGGPIFKNQTFFFFSYEGLRLRQPQTASGHFYTKSARAAVAPVYQPLVNALPVPNGAILNSGCDNVTTPCLASLTVSYSNPTTFDAYSLRLDHTLKQRATLFARYSHTPSVQGFRTFSYIEYDSLNTDTATAGATVTLSSTKLDDFRANWSRSYGKAIQFQDNSFGAVPPPSSAIYRPGDSFNGDEELIGLPDDGQFVEVGTRVANVQRQLNFVDTFSMTTGTHQLKFGADFRRLQPTNQGDNGYGLFLSNFTQLTAGTMGFVVAEGAPAITAKLFNWSLFAQDTWKAARRLTLTYGVRWEINTPPVSTTPGMPLYAVQGIFDSNPFQLAPAGTPLWRTRYSGFAPRVGAAYQLTPQTVIRSGFGLFYDSGYSGQLGKLIFGFPYTRYSFQSGAGQAFNFNNPLFQTPTVSTSLSAISIGNYVSAFDSNLQLPRTWHWNAALERGLGAKQSLSLTYLGADGQRLLRPDLIIPAGSGLAANLSAVIATRNAGYSHYNALQVQFQRHMIHGLQALISYSLAKSSDIESDDVGGNFEGAEINGNSASSPSQIQLPPLARSDFDIRHSFSAAVSYAMPTPSSSWGKAASAILKGWAVDGIVRASSAPPLNVRIQGISPVLGYYFTQPDEVAGQPFWLAAPGQPAGKILNPNAFTLPAVGALGDFPRNSLQSPFGISQTDIALRRRFHLTERVTLDIRAEYFNVFNHPMFGGPYGPQTFWGTCRSLPCTGQQSSSFGTVSTSTAPLGGTLNNGLGAGGINGGQSALYALGGPRSAQFTLKLQF
jgi:hypothetical protein